MKLEKIAEELKGKGKMKNEKELTEILHMNEFQDKILGIKCNSSPISYVYGIDEENKLQKRAYNEKRGGRIPEKEIKRHPLLSTAYNGISGVGTSAGLSLAWALPFSQNSEHYVGLSALLFSLFSIGGLTSVPFWINEAINDYRNDKIAWEKYKNVLGMIGQKD